MIKREKWTVYLWLSLIAFGCFLLEYFSIFVLERLFIGHPVQEYTSVEMAVHSFLTAGLWAAGAALLLFYSSRRCFFPRLKRNRERIYPENWLTALLCLAGCKVITFLDWHTLKVIGEWRIKTPLQFTGQYVYYLAEILLACLVVFYGQKAFEVRLGRRSELPFGGILLAATWGAMHFFSRGFDLWNGLSCMVFALLSGVMYLAVKRKIPYAYLLIAIGYLL